MTARQQSLMISTHPSNQLGEIMSRILCFFGLHTWQHRHNPEVGGSGGVYEVCSRCGKEKAGYGKPPSTGVARG